MMKRIQRNHDGPSNAMKARPGGLFFYPLCASMLLFLYAPFAFAGFGYADSDNFNLDTQRIGSSIACGTSADFNMDLQRMRRGWADSADVYLDTNSGEVNIDPAHEYRVDDHALLIWAQVTDACWGEVYDGTFTWVLRNTNNPQVADGIAYYDSAQRTWYSATTISGLDPGNYTVICSIMTNLGRMATTMTTLQVGK